MGDVVTAIAIRSEYEMLDAGDLIAFIGKPDSIATQGAAEVWNYDWVGFHGPKQIYFLYTVSRIKWTRNWCRAESKMIGIARRALANC